jgi:hypothetical protein
LTKFEEEVLIALYQQPDLSARQVRSQWPYKQRNDVYLACDKLYQQRLFDYPDKATNRDEDRTGILDGQLTYTGRLKAANILAENKKFEAWKRKQAGS